MFFVLWRCLKGRVLRHGDMQPGVITGRKWGPGAVQGALLQAGGLFTMEKQGVGSAPLEVASAELGLVAAFRALGKTQCDLPGVKNKAPGDASLQVCKTTMAPYTSACFV